MNVVLTVKMKPSPGEVLDPMDVYTVIEGYRKVHAAGTLGQPEAVELRFMVEGTKSVEIIDLPPMQAAAPVQVVGVPVIE